MRIIAQAFERTVRLSLLLMFFGTTNMADTSGGGGLIELSIRRGIGGRCGGVVVVHRHSIGHEDGVLVVGHRSESTGKLRSLSFSLSLHKKTKREIPKLFLLISQNSRPFCFLLGLSSVMAAVVERPIIDRYACKQASKLLLSLSLYFSIFLSFPFPFVSFYFSVSMSPSMSVCVSLAD